MGVLPALVDNRTRTDDVSFVQDHGRGVDLETSELVSGASGGHVEIMRGRLAAILHEATRNDGQYLFGDSIRTIDQQPDGVAVTFEHAPADRFDVIVGADGLHSEVRRLAFGPERGFRRFLGGYLAGIVLPNYLHLDGRMVVWNAPGRLAAIYPVHQDGTARAGFLFRQREELPLDDGDVDGQKRSCIRSTERKGGRFPGCWPRRLRREPLLRLHQPDRHGPLDFRSRRPHR